MAEYSIRNIINKIQNGEIRIPSFQRGYVWEYDNVAFLVDSIYKGFPIGSILFWRTGEQLNTEKQLGNYILPPPQKNYPIDYVLDGQQRLTSLFSVFQTELEPEVENEMDIYFIIDELDNIQKSRFVPLSKEDADNQKIKDRAPSEYKKEIVGDLKEIMGAAICPENALDISYEEFIKMRTDMLLDYANSLI